MPDLSIFKIDSQTINIKDTTARQTADSAKTLATTASDNATTALNKINELESEKADKTLATDSANGLMSKSDKAKLDGIDPSAITTNAANIKKNADAISVRASLIPTGKELYAGDDLNNISYTAVGTYYCSAIVDAQHISNLPEATAFMMTVYNPNALLTGPLSTPWQYRVQEFMPYYGTQKYIRMVNTDGASNVTFGDWVKTINSNDLSSVSKIINDHIANESNPHAVTKAQVGLGNVDNTSDANKPISTAVQTALDKKANKTIVTEALNKINELESEISALKSDLANKLYPVGSIYMSVNATNPAELFGGTWEQIKGRFLIGTGANDANTTDWWGHEDANQFNIPAGELGGETHHTLTVDEMPSHTHATRLGWNNTKGWGIAGSESDAANATVDADTKTWSTGGGEPHNNMPPYLAVYMWKRTA